MVTKPLLLGLNNPLSVDPADALVPWPDGCSGHRLYCALREVRSTFTIANYLEAFDRANLLPAGASLPAIKRDQRRLMRECAKRLRNDARDFHAGRDIVVLGRDSWEAMYNCIQSLRGVVVLESRMALGVRWHRVPHPSGRSLWYNEEANRRAVGELLLRLAGVTT